MWKTQRKIILKDEQSLRYLLYNITWSNMCYWSPRRGEKMEQEKNELMMLNITNR